MSKVKLIGFSLLLLAAVTAVAAENEMSPSTADVPMAIVHQVRYKFPDTIDGIAVQHVFVIQNKGQAPLIIENVRTSCGCTTALTAEDACLIQA